ncbi:hypothetical protein AMECASPLE_026079 [Ameca splendens]|uniref:Uncharacterized protein n=1 Tax=Ameca splendens TaxID=208324 RepID=A0ABV0Y5D5_9TELE
MSVCLGRGTMVEDFRQGGMEHWERDCLKMAVKILANWSAQSPSTLPVTPSGPAALRGFTALKTLLTSCISTVKVWLSRGVDCSVGPRWWFNLEAGEEVVKLLRQ